MIRDREETLRPRGCTASNAGDRVSRLSFFFSSRRRHTRWNCDWSSDVCSSDLLLGRGTYEIFAAHWPEAPEEQYVLAEPLNALPKYVASTTLGEPLGWRNSRLLRGDIGAAVRALKAEEIGRASCRERGEIAVGA